MGRKVECVVKIEDYEEERNRPAPLSQAVSSRSVDRMLSDWEERERQRSIDFPKVTSDIVVPGGEFYDPVENKLVHRAPKVICIHCRRPRIIASLKCECWGEELEKNGNCSSEESPTAS